jgi:hypothetical protein
MCARLDHDNEARGGPSDGEVMARKPNAGLKPKQRANNDH